MASPQESASEGEIVEVTMDKALMAQPAMNDSRVDRQYRHDSSASTSPESDVDRASRRRSRSRSRSPYRKRSPRGEKRRRDRDNSVEREHDKRRFRAHHEDSGRQRGSYSDVGRHNSRGASHTSRNSRDPAKDRRRRSRSRSRSPYSRRKEAEKQANSMRTHFKPAGTGGGADANRGSHWPDRNGEGRVKATAQHRPANQVRKTVNFSMYEHDPHSSPSLADYHGRALGSKELPEETKEADAVPTELDEAAQIEERRKRREALKAKLLKGQGPSLLAQALHIASDSGQSTPKVETSTPAESRSASPMIGSPKSQTADSPATFNVDDDNDMANHSQDVLVDDADEPSAADYDPTLDMKEDRARHDQMLHHNDAPATKYDGREDVDTIDESREIIGDDVKAKKDEFDMFADDDEDDDDMFAPATTAKAKGNQKSKAKELDASLLDNWDDPDGYYRVILGELLDGRYHVQANLGKGMFSSVVRATDNKSDKLVAIKIIRNNESMKKAGLKEVAILQKILAADPDDKKHIIRLERWFEHKSHLCMVFENLSNNLREVLKKFVAGINLKAIRLYAQQIFLGLTLLKKCNIIHADIKPDNMLVNESRNLLKVCDLGSAGDASENEITPYLVSRFYRAPEIILGMKYDFGVDIWSVGCTLYELYTGKILFTGRNNNQMLRSIMECRGKFSLKMLKKAEYVGIHFDDKFNFRSVETDKVTGKDVVRMLSFLKPTRDLKTRLMGAAKGLGESDLKELQLFADFLDRCLQTNPEKRMTAAEALKHPFISRARG